MEKLKFALNVLLMVVGFPLLLGANLTHDNHQRGDTLKQIKKVSTAERGNAINAATDNFSFIIRYPGLLIQ